MTFLGYILSGSHGFSCGIPWHVTDRPQASVKASYCVLHTVNLRKAAVTQDLSAGCPSLRLLATTKVTLEPELHH